MPPIFPNAARGAVSLTYDDGSADHLDAAMPDLERHGLRGTFFVATRLKSEWSCFEQRPAEWRAAATRGHEIGNHTQYHPCGKGPDWVKPNFSLEAYSLARMEAELTAANRDLDDAVGPASARSFAYPCCQSYVGPEQTSYRPMAARLFPACRGGAGRQLVDPFDCDFAFVPSRIITAKTPLRDVLHFVDEAVEQQKWAVLTFHNVGPAATPLAVPRPTHEAIVEYVARRRADVWCDTFLAVASHLRASLKIPRNGR
jgi:peptidoglycan-N-acetylglucosamine deacetylase